jgi:hypothetical protein
MSNIIWRNNDVNRFFKTFGIQCYYFESRIAPDQRYGQTRLDSDAIHGFRYNDPVEERLMRTSINQRIIFSEQGRCYEGGAQFSIPPVKLLGNEYVPVEMYERIFLGDVIVIKSKSMRDFDVLKKGFRDQLFAFDVKKILNVASVDIEGKEHVYSYGTDYTLIINGKEATITDDSVPIGEGGFGAILFGGKNEVEIVATQDKISSTILINWKDDGNSPAYGNYYTVEFLCSPNYVAFNYSDKERATEDNNLPKTVMCVKRAYFNPVKPKMDEVDTKEEIMATSSEVFDS